MLEKLVLALVYTARCLHRYFQGNPINVLTGYKLKNVLSKPEPSGRLEEWAIELGEHSIEYRPRPAIKGQVLADFATEVRRSKEEECLIEQRISVPPERDQITKKLGVKHLEAQVYSMLIAGQINGTYEATNDMMASYLSQEKDLILQFSSCKTSSLKSLIILLSHNIKCWSYKPVLSPGCTDCGILSIWNSPRRKVAARKIRHKALNYQIQDGVLNRRSFLGQLLRCVDAEDANYLIREIHEGICSLHAGPRMVMAKPMNVGYYWPGMHMDAVQEIRKCDSCQRHAPNTLRRKNELLPVTSAWPFQKWSTDIMGRFPEALGRVKFLIVAIYYFTKWVEAKPVASITAASIKKF
ncbi:uncharacterized protein LOC143565958 [Bidens hawaiensis]|uniref:uncharacterized protein LOC143565958 n=1 Tax=Bidens hawaiensis TaxID=980011 RepID=UPI00404935A9